MMPIMQFISNLGYVAVCILGGYLAATGSIQIGDIQAFMQYVRRFNQPLSQVANISNILQQTAAASERVFNFLEQEEEVPDTATPLHIVPKGQAVAAENDVSIQGSVQFDHVKFGYNPEKIIVNDFCASVKARPEGGDCRPDRRGQNHHDQAAHAVLRRKRRGYLDRRPRYP